MTKRGIANSVQQRIDASRARVEVAREREGLEATVLRALNQKQKEQEK
jgi:hypothetical protein